MDQSNSATGSRLPLGFHEMRQCVHRILIEGFSEPGTPMSKDYEGDYEYDRATNLRHDLNGRFPLTIKVTEYRPIVAAFVQSVERIRLFHWLPIELIYIAQMVTIAESTALMRLGKDPSEPRSQTTDEENDLAEKIFHEMMGKVARDFGGKHNHTWSNGNVSLKAYLQAEIQGLEPRRKTYGIDAVLAAIITAGYGALETMAADLWIAAVNRHPALAKNYTKATPGKQIDLSVAAGYDFNMAGKMGTVLVQTRKIQFNSFYDLKDAYEAAFGASIEKVFEDNENVLHAEKVRHLIAHRGGIVDQKFKDEMKGRAEYDALEIGQQIDFSGPMVAAHLGACLDMAVNIIRAVDEWSSVEPRAIV